MRIFKNVKKIAILRANALGDFIFSLPAAKALRAAYPRAEIVLLGKKWHKDFLKDRASSFDRVEVVPGYPGVSEAEDYKPNQSELARFFFKMEKERFDLAFQMHGGGRNSNPFLLRLGAKLTFGLKTPDAEPLDFNIPYIYFQHEILRYLEVARLAGAQGFEILPSIRPTPSDIAQASPLLPDGKLVLLHPGASDLRRRWPTEKFAEIGDRLAAEGFAVGLTGTKEESGLTSRIHKAMKRKPIDYTGRLTLSSLIGLLSMANLLISNDTGPLHLGLSVGLPTVGIYWCGNLINAGPFFRRTNRPVVSWQIYCPDCGASILTDDRKGCRHEMSFVSEISTNEVYEQALDLLEQRETVKNRWLNS